MVCSRESIGDLLISEIRTNVDGEPTVQEPAVLSCGGIYIPHSPNQQHTIYEIINTSSEREPVKIVAGSRPRNLLKELLRKESMN